MGRMHIASISRAQSVNARTCCALYALRQGALKQLRSNSTQPLQRQQLYYSLYDLYPPPRPGMAGMRFLMGSHHPRFSPTWYVTCSQWWRRQQQRRVIR